RPAWPRTSKTNTARSHWKAYKKSVSSLRMNRLRDLSSRVQAVRRRPAAESPSNRRRGGVAARVARCQSENLASRPHSGGSVRPPIVRDRTLRAWLGEDDGRATLVARLNSCSQPSAELFVLLLETSQSLHTAFFNDKISL